MKRRDVRSSHPAVDALCEKSLPLVCSGHWPVDDTVNTGGKTPNVPGFEPVVSMKLIVRRASIGSHLVR